MELSVRPLTEGDFDRFLNYWTELSPADIECMGVAVDLLPSREQMLAGLETMLSTPNDRANSFVLAWCINGEAVGHSSLKDIVPGDFGSVHLHMWREDLRGKGYGPSFFSLAVIDFYERFSLKRMICEPKVDNPAANRLLQRIGFPLVSTRIGAGSELGMICELNHYDIRRQIAESFLATRGLDRSSITT